MTTLEGSGSITRRNYSFKIPISSLSVEVGVYNLVPSETPRSFPTMRMFHKCSEGSPTPISRLDWCEKCGRAVARDETIRGYAISKEQYSYFTTEELDAIQAQFQSETMRVLGVTRLDSLPIEAVMETHLLLPPESKTKKGQADADRNAKYYALLADKLAKDKVYVVGKVFQRAELFCAIGGDTSSGQPLLMMYSLYYADELRNPANSKYSMPAISDGEKNLMSTLIDKNMKPLDYKTITSELETIFNDLLSKRVAGELPPVTPATAPIAVAEVKNVEDELQKALGMAAPRDIDEEREDNEWIREILSNDEASTDEELVAHFINNGLSENEALAWVKERSKYLNHWKFSADDEKKKEMIKKGVKWQHKLGGKAVQKIAGKVEKKGGKVGKVAGGVRKFSEKEEKLMDPALDVVTDIGADAIVKMKAETKKKTAIIIGVVAVLALLAIWSYKKQE